MAEKLHDYRKSYEKGALSETSVDENPMQLKKWRVIDPQGLITEVELFYVETGVKHPRGFFAYRAPDSNKPRFNQ